MSMMLPPHCLLVSVSSMMPATIIYQNEEVYVLASTTNKFDILPNRQGAGSKLYVGICRAAEVGSVICFVNIAITCSYHLHINQIAIF